MKKLSNVSPFIMLLVPLFMVMIFGLFASKSENQNNQMANTSTKVSIPAPVAKVAQGIAIAVK